MPGFCFKPDQQSLEAIEPGIGVLDHSSVFKEFLIKIHILLITIPITGVEDNKCVLLSLFLHIGA
jgi:hypothetical protein